MLSFITGCSSDNVNEKVENEAKKEPMSLEDQIKEMVIKNVGQRNKDKIKINFIEDVIAGEGNKIVNIEAFDSVSKLQYLDYSRDVFQKAFKINGISEVNITWVDELVDVKGNTEELPIMRILLRKDNAQDINWENFDIYNFKIVADQYWEHKSLE